MVDKLSETAVDSGTSLFVSCVVLSETQLYKNSTPAFWNEAKLTYLTGKTNGSYASINGLALLSVKTLMWPPEKDFLDDDEKKHWKNEWFSGSYSLKFQSELSMDAIPK